jgi:hypothetical protein
MTGKLTSVLAMALVFSGLQCAAWCTVSACGLTQPSEAGSHNVPPCHGQHTDSSKNSPAVPCSHGIVIANVATLSVAQAPVAAPLVAIFPVQPETSRGVLISGNESAVLTPLPPGSGGPSSSVLRI